MKLILHGRHVDITENLEEYVAKKVRKLERHLPRLDEIRAEFTARQTRAMDDHYTCQITIWTDRGILRAEDTTGTIYAAADSTVDKLLRQIEKVHGRRRKVRHASAVAKEAAIVATTEINEAEIAEDIKPEIVRRKEFYLHPMMEEDAMEQMELLGHDFYLFFNSDTDSINLLYRRRDENYGLLQPRIR